MLPARALRGLRCLCHPHIVTIPPSPSAFNSSPNGAHRARAIAIWESQFPALDDMLDRLHGPHMRIEARSSLDLDDRYLGSWGGGGLQQSALAAAHSSLVTAQTVLESGSLPMTGLYPLFRTALESSSLAIYLLGPKMRDDRLGRVFQVAAEESRHRRNYQIQFGNPNAQSTHEETIAELRTLAALRPSLGTLDRFLDRGASNSAIVIWAGEVIAARLSTTTESRVPFLGLWQLLSGLSHAKQWAMIQSLHRSGAVVDAATNRAVVEMRSDDSTIAFVMVQAVEALEVALGLYGERAGSTHAQPEDRAEPR
jgi:hypothetical protein